MPIDVSQSVKQITYNGNNVPLASQANTATITISIEGYTNPKYAIIFYTNQDGQFTKINDTTKLTFPLTINTFVNSGITFIPSSWGGIVNSKNEVNCDIAGYQGAWHIAVLGTECSITLYNAD